MNEKFFKNVDIFDSGHHLVNQQHSNMQNSSGPPQQMQERHSQIQQSSEPVSNARMDNNPKKRMLSQQQHQMVNYSDFICNGSEFQSFLFIWNSVKAISTNAASSRACTN